MFFLKEPKDWGLLQLRKLSRNFFGVRNSNMIHKIFTIISILFLLFFTQCSMRPSHNSYFDLKSKDSSKVLALSYLINGNNSILNKCIAMNSGYSVYVSLCSSNSVHYSTNNICQTYCSGTCSDKTITSSTTTYYQCINPSAYFNSLSQCNTVCNQ